MLKETLEIDLNNKYDLVDKYNEKKLSNEILDYMIKESLQIKKDRSIEVVLNKKCHINKDVTKLIRDGLKKEYDRNLKEYHRNNIKQILFLVLGFLVIFLSTLVNKESIWNEVLLIAGWVPIWDAVEVEILNDVESRKKRKVIKRLLKSKFSEKIVRTETTF